MVIPQVLLVLQLKLNPETNQLCIEMAGNRNSRDTSC